ncbi:MAG: 3-deoxy-7-phosphoheptulonate synthase [Spirochaetota bacterium]|nr:3-deoxy-7-phosphoheptulonate synthase [Spirochaetota bacterium]
MIIVLKQSVTKEEIDHIVKKIEALGLKTHISKGSERSIIGVIGDERKLLDKPIEAIDGVEKVMPVLKPYKLASRDFHPDNSEIKVRDQVIGGKKLAIIAGPCTVETEEQTVKTAHLVKKAGANILRGGAYKPRTSPYTFMGHGEDALKILATAREETGLAICTEVMDTRDVELVCKYTDILQIGTRNIQNFNLLMEVGKTDKTVLLKRGFSSTIKEWLMSAEYVMSQGNLNVILCERGIRTFETSTRNTLDITAIPVIKELSHLPIIVDPSHASGKRSYVGTLAKASIAAGADGLLIEVHHNPEEALVDGEQSLTPNDFDKLMKELVSISQAVGREI